MRRLALLFCAACATLADGGPGLDNPPSSRAGPFRALKVGELGQGRAVPNALDDQKLRQRDLAVVDPDGAPDTLLVEGYFAENDEGEPVDAPPRRIVRSLARDGRSFAHETSLVLEPTQPWEGGQVGAPSVVARGDARELFYEAAGGLGVARSEDGVAFVSADEPVLDPAAVPWAEGPLESPGALLLPDGSYRLFFHTQSRGATVIGVARSDDGRVFEDAEIALSPGRADGVIDGAGVADPSPILAESAEGRQIVYLYYAASATDGKRSIGLAARFFTGVDDEERYEKNPQAMFAPSGSLEPRAPTVARFESVSFLFTTQKKSRDSSELVVAAAVSPGNVALPAVDPP